MRHVSDYEVLTRALRADRGAGDDLAGTHVFVPGLMGAGILMSAGILVGDGVKKLFPNSGTRRQVEVVRGVQSVVAGVAASAGVEIEESNISRRAPRSFLFYALGAVLFGILAVTAVSLGIIEFNDDGVFEGNAISIVFGSVVGAFAGAVAIILAALAVGRRHRIPVITRIMETTVLGRLQSPPDSRVERARLLLPRFQEGETT